ncbi:MAG: VOC family protein [bacterium]|nr:VOC family protein [bacterium]
MKTPSIYLNFDGNCKAAFHFYQSVFGKEISLMETFGNAENNPMGVAEEEQELIMYTELNIAGIKLCGSDFVPSLGQHLVKGNANYIVLNAESPAEADTLFAKLAVNGTIEMPMSQEFFGYCGSFEDQFGVRWMIIAE